MLHSLERDAAQRLIECALEEDLGNDGDITSQTLLSEFQEGRGIFIARESGVVAGLPLVDMVLEAVSPFLAHRALLKEGSHVDPGDELAEVRGSIRSILMAERTCLNFLQRLSGIATLTRKFVDLVAGLSVQILDTRKTTPGWRRLEKYAVRVGGGTNHRLGLMDGFLVKDNHWSALTATSRPNDLIARVVHQARQSRFADRPITIELDTLEHFDEALAAKPDVILLDNMPLDMMRRAVDRKRATESTVLLEASGGVTLATVRAIAETGIDRISVGALTHSPPALDISLELRMGA